MPDLEACSLEWVCCLIKVICDRRSYHQLVVFYLFIVILFLLYCWFAIVVTKNHKTLPKSVRAFLNPQMQPRQLMAFVVVHSLSHVQLCNPMDCSTPGSSVLHHLQSLLKFTSMELVMLSNHLILCYPLLLCLQSFPLSGSFPVSWLFVSGGQKIASLASASVFTMNTQVLISFSIDCLISLLSKGLSSVFPSTILVLRVTHLYLLICSSHPISDSFNTFNHTQIIYGTIFFSFQYLLFIVFIHSLGLLG